MREKIRRWFYLAILIFLLLFPLIFTSNYAYSIIMYMFVLIFLAVSLNMVLGYVGIISFGHAAFFGLGAYVSGLLTYYFHIPYYIGFIAALVSCMILGALIGVVTLKLQGINFAIVTLALAEILRVITLNFIDLTRGPMGVSIPQIGFGKNYHLSYYYFILIILMIILLTVYKISHSPLGKRFIAIRENEDLAKSVGINPFSVKEISLILSAGIAGIAGAAYAHYILFIEPGLFGLYYTTIGLLMVIIGGKGTFSGPIIGAIIFALLPEVLRFADASVNMILFGLLLLISIIFFPNGILSGIFNSKFRNKKDLEKSRALSRGE